MPYSTLTDLQQIVAEHVLVRLTQDDPDASVVDEDVVASAIADGDAVIDGYLSGRYATPLSPVPTVVRSISLAFARYALFSRRGYDPKGPDAVVRMDYDDRMKLLQAIGRGEVSLAAPAQVAEPSATAAIVSSPRVMSRERLEDF
jgi:phage gp36-like protein